MRRVRPKTGRLSNACAYEIRLLHERRQVELQRQVFERLQKSKGGAAVHDQLPAIVPRCRQLPRNICKRRQQVRKRLSSLQKGLHDGALAPSPVSAQRFNSG
jgi:hypothetical protein